MRPGTAKGRRRDTSDEDERIARELAVQESLEKAYGISTDTERPMTASTRQRFAEDEAIAWQLKYEEEMRQLQDTKEAHLNSVDILQPQSDNEELETQLEYLWKSIEDYQPPPELEFRPILHCFIPNYQPAIGDLDPMIKVQPPASIKLPYKLGLTQLDEPSLQQSDPSIVKLQLKSREKSVQMSSPASITRLDMTKKESNKVLANWCQSVLDLQSKITQDRVFYQKRMPALESLMAVWGDSFGENAEHESAKELQAELRKVQNIQLAELDISLDEMAKICCLMFDIPVYDSNKSLVESLHVLFSLYHELELNMRNKL